MNAATKIVLVPEPPAVPAASGVRRYRLARLALNPACDPAQRGFEHLKRTYD